MRTGILLIILAGLASAATVYCGSMGDGQTIPFSGQYYDQMRFQTLFTSSQLGISGTVTQIAFRVQDNGGIGIYHNASVTLCHTDLNFLGATFNDNYDGYSPVDTLTGADILVPGLANAWVVLDFTLPFPYNVAHNLIVEVKWDTDNQVDVPVWAWDPSSGDRHVYSSDITAPTGITGRYAYYMRFIISGIGVDDTSLGRIKATFSK